MGSNGEGADRKGRTILIGAAAARIRDRDRSDQPAVNVDVGSVCRAGRTGIQLDEKRAS